MGRSTYSMWITNKIHDASVYKLLNFIFNTKNKATAETEINLPFGAVEEYDFEFPHFIEVILII